MTIIKGIFTPLFEAVLWIFYPGRSVDIETFIDKYFIIMMIILIAVWFGVRSYRKGTAYFMLSVAWSAFVYIIGLTQLDVGTIESQLHINYKHMVETIAVWGLRALVAVIFLMILIMALGTLEEWLIKFFGKLFESKENTEKSAGCMVTQKEKGSEN